MSQSIKWSVKDWKPMAIRRVPDRQGSYADDRAKGRGMPHPKSKAAKAAMEANRLKSTRQGCSECGSKLHRACEPGGTKQKVPDWVAKKLAERGLTESPTYVNEADISRRAMRLAAHKKMR